MKKLLITAMATAALCLTSYAEVYNLDSVDMDAPGGTAYEISLEPRVELLPVYDGVTMTDQEVWELERILAMEAQDEGLEGEKAVVEVIFNRVQSGDWPNTVHDVISQKGQFSTWKYLNWPYNQPGKLETDAISAVMTETTKVLPDGYVFFATRRHGWMHDCIKLGGHWFGR